MNLVPSRKNPGDCKKNGQSNLALPSLGKFYFSPPHSKPGVMVMLLKPILLLPSPLLQQLTEMEDFHLLSLLTTLLRETTRTPLNIFF